MSEINRLNQLIFDLRLKLNVARQAKLKKQQIEIFKQLIEAYSILNRLIEAQRGLKIA